MMAKTATIELKNVSYAYSEQAKAIDSLSLRIGAGDRLALLGQNGSGKTTLAKILAGLIEPKAGQVFIDGQNIQSLTTAQRVRTISYVFQNPDHQIFSPTVRQELAFGPKNLGLQGDELERRVDSTLRQFDLESLAEMSPAMLSYGLRRKLTVASVAALHSPILVLDEPSLGLDWGSATEMLDRLLEAEHAPRTLILISHDVDLAARYTQQVALLAQGRLAEHGMLNALLADEKIMRQHGLKSPAIAQLAASLRRKGIPIKGVEVEAFSRNVASWLAEIPE